MPDDTETKEQKAHDQAVKRAGHWRLPLSGHGLAYFDQLVVAYRTLPEHGSSEDPWARAAASAAQEAKTRADTSLIAAKDSAAAAAAAAAAPGNAGLNADKTAKAQLAELAKATSDAANKELARLDGAVSSKLAAGQIIIELIQKHERKEAIWSDLLVFEAALLRMLWFDALKTRLQGLRQEYSDTMGAAAAATMSATYLDLKELKEEKDFVRVQAEAVNLLSELHWQYVSAPRLEWQKAWMSITLGFYTTAVCAFILLTCLRVRHWSAESFWPALREVLHSLHFHCSTVSLVMLAGAVGAGLSAFQRIQNNSGSGAALLNLRDSKWSSISVGMAPLIGALSALMLALIFAGGIISGPFFPKVTLRTDDCSTNAPLANTTGNAPAIKPSEPSAPPAAAAALPAAPAPAPANPSPPVASGLATLGAGATVITNTNGLTISIATTNVHTLTNATSDPLTWRDCKTICEHRWCVAAGADLALLLLWGVIAGFSERLVPDMLSRLAKKAEEKV